jgi:hypothetical protein
MSVLATASSLMQRHCHFVRLRESRADFVVTLSTENQNSKTANSILPVRFFRSRCRSWSILSEDSDLTGPTKLEKYLLASRWTAAVHMSPCSRSMQRPEFSSNVICRQSMQSLWMRARATAVYVVCRMNGQHSLSLVTTSCMSNTQTARDGIANGLASRSSSMPLRRTIGHRSFTSNKKEL